MAGSKAKNQAGPGEKTAQSESRDSLIFIQLQQHLPDSVVDLLSKAINRHLAETSKKAVLLPPGCDLLPYQDIDSLIATIREQNNTITLMADQVSMLLSALMTDEDEDAETGTGYLSDL